MANLICPFCDKNLATKENSHIITNFLTHSMKKTERGNKLFKIAGPNKYFMTQDSSKEDNIFCPQCESQFNSKYERYISNTFYKSYQTKSNCFNVRLSKQKLFYRVYTDTDYVTFQKFWLLQLYRVHVSDLPEFVNFKLNTSQLKLVRENLLYEDHFKDVKITVLSTDLLADKTSNIIFAVPNKNESYTIWMNEFVCIYHFKPSFTLIPDMSEGSNYNNNSPRVIFMNLASWSYFRHLVFDLVANNF